MEPVPSDESSSQAGTVIPGPSDLEAKRQRLDDLIEAHPYLKLVVDYAKQRLRGLELAQWPNLGEIASHIARSPKTQKPSRHAACAKLRDALKSMEDWMDNHDTWEQAQDEEGDMPYVGGRSAVLATGVISKFGITWQNLEVALKKTKLSFLAKVPRGDENEIPEFWRGADFDSSDWRREHMDKIGAGSPVYLPFKDELNELIWSTVCQSKQNNGPAHLPAPRPKETPKPALRVPETIQKVAVSAVSSIARPEPTPITTSAGATVMTHEQAVITMDGTAVAAAPATAPLVPTESPPEEPQSSSVGKPPTETENNTELPKGSDEGELSTETENNSELPKDLNGGGEANAQGNGTNGDTATLRQVPSTVVDQTGQKVGDRIPQQAILETATPSQIPSTVMVQTGQKVGNQIPQQALSETTTRSQVSPAVVEQTRRMVGDQIPQPAISNTGTMTPAETQPISQGKRTISDVNDESIDQDAKPEVKRQKTIHHAGHPETKDHGTGVGNQGPKKPRRVIKSSKIFDTLRKLEDESDRCAKDRVRFNETLDSLQQSHAAVLGSCTDAEAKVKAVEEQMVNISTRCDALTDDMREQEKQGKQTAAQCSAHEEEIKALRAQVAALQAQNDTIKAEDQAIKDECEAMKSKMAALEDENKAVKSLLGDIIVRMETLEKSRPRPEVKLAPTPDSTRGRSTMATQPSPRHETPTRQGRNQPETQPAAPHAQSSHCPKDREAVTHKPSGEAIAHNSSGTHHTSPPIKQEYLHEPEAPQPVQSVQYKPVSGRFPRVLNPPSFPRDWEPELIVYNSRPNSSNVGNWQRYHHSPHESGSSAAAATCQAHGAARQAQHREYGDQPYNQRSPPPGPGQVENPVAVRNPHVAMDRAVLSTERTAAAAPAAAVHGYDGEGQWARLRKEYEQRCRSLTPPRDREIERA